MGNIYDALIDFGYDDTEEDFETEMNLDRDIPDGILIDDEPDYGETRNAQHFSDVDELESWVDSVVGEPEYLGER